jgi:hypothetical protein
VVPVPRVPTPVVPVIVEPVEPVGPLELAVLNVVLGCWMIPASTISHEEMGAVMVGPLT